MLPRRSEEHTSELQSRQYLVCRLLLEKKKKKPTRSIPTSQRSLATSNRGCSTSASSTCSTVTTGSVFFFLMIRRPPRSTLFPYTTPSDLRQRPRMRRRRTRTRRPMPWWPAQRPPPRSEEHTSELQSRQYLVCRLLLEK